MKKMGLIGNVLVDGWLNFGQFDLFNPLISPKRKLINRLIKLVLFFNVVKLIIILLAAWLGFPELKLYLIEIFLFDEEHQKLFDIAIFVILLGISRGYCYWVSLNEKTTTLKSFRFLLIPDSTKDRSRYGRNCQLDQQSTDKFLLIYRLACSFQRVLLSAYSIFAVLVIARCLYHSFFTVSLVYFLSGCLLLSATTLSSYLIMANIVASRFILAILSTVFLICRIMVINNQICNRFSRTELIPANGSKLRKQKANLLKILNLLDEFCQQFKEINLVLDSSISLYLVGLLIFLFVLPFFLLFIQNEPSIRLFLGFLAIVTYMFCFLFSICNDRLRRQVLRHFVYTAWSCPTNLLFGSFSDQGAGEQHTLHSAAFPVRNSQNFVQQLSLDEQHTSDHLFDLSDLLRNRLRLERLPGGRRLLD